MKKLLCIFGGPGAGKDTVIEALGKELPIVRIPRMVTKPNTRNEEDGVVYRFVSEDEFTAVESDMIYVQHHGGYRYGIERDYLLRRWAEISDEGQQPLLMSNIEEALAVHGALPDVLLVFITAPSVEEAERRVRQRPDDPRETEKKVAGILRNHERFEALSPEAKGLIHVVINDEVPNAVRAIRELITT